MDELEYKTYIHDKALKVTNLDDLEELILNVQNRRQTHSTACHGAMAVMIAAFNVIQNTFNLSEYQRGCVGWEVVKEFMILDKNAPAQLLDFSNMLYPHGEEKFSRTITRKNWEWIQKQAQKKIDGVNKSEAPHSAKTFDHWKSIVDGNVPFGFDVVEVQ